MSITPAYQGTIEVVWIDLDFCKEKKMRMGHEVIRQNNSHVHILKQLSICCGLSRKRHHKLTERSDCYQLVDLGELNVSSWV